MDGYAVRAAETLGASDYNPLHLPSALPVANGQAMPPGRDAVAAFAIVGRHGPASQALAPVARGEGIERRGAEGDMPPPGLLRPESLALLALLGVPVIQAVRRPRVALMAAGPKSGPDVLTPMLRALVARDGGVAVVQAGVEAASHAGADLLLLAGRTGFGRDDDMPQRFMAAGGVLDLHGIAFRPGDTAGLGRLGGMPAVLLPGSPLAALSVYEVLAGPAVRRLGGRADAPAHLERQAVLERKITSAIGCTDMVRVRLCDGRATPLGSAGSGGLGRAVPADGWLIVPEGGEGYPAGAVVTVQCPA
jgi:molybdopterin molybdotransferase